MSLGARNPKSPKSLVTWTMHVAMCSVLVFDEQQQTKHRIWRI